MAQTTIIDNDMASLSWPQAMKGNDHHTDLQRIEEEEEEEEAMPG